MVRYQDLELEYKVAATFSLGMMITAFDYQFTNGEYYGIVVEGLDGADIAPEKAQEIPSLVFMLPCFATYETAAQITRVVD